MLLLVSVLVAACARRPPPAPSAWPADRATCFVALSREPVAFADWPDAPNGGSCTVPAPVVVTATTAALTPALRTSCPMMLAWSRFEPEMQRLAQQRLGSPIAEIHHYGSHSCRRMTGNARRMSLHSTGLALDIAGFTTADGRHVSVQTGWRGGRAERAFLNELSHAACRHFQVVLTPDHDRAHDDHLHVDIGPWRFCGV